MPEAKVLVGCPVTSYKKEILEAYLQGLKDLTYKDKEIILIDNSPDEEIFKQLEKEKFLKVEKSKHLDNVRDMIIRDRNRLREIALEKGFDYFFSLEQDVVPPKDVIERLLQNSKDVCSCLYFNYAERLLMFPDGRQMKRFDLAPIAFQWQDSEIKEIKLTRRMNFSEAFPSRLQQVQLTGLGCVLIHRKALEKVPFRHEKGASSFDDLFFGMDCQDNGFGVWLDSRLGCKHLFSEMSDDIKRRF